METIRERKELIARLAVPRSILLVRQDSCRRIDLHGSGEEDNQGKTRAEETAGDERR